MAVRFKCEFNTKISGDLIRVELLDSAYAGSPTILPELFSPGLVIEYEGQGDERHEAIKGSSASINLKIGTDSASTALETWLKGTMLNNNEDRYHVAIYKNENIFWYGVMLPDLSEWANAPKPYRFTLKATDGIKRLETYSFDWALTYSGGDAPNTRQAKFTTIIHEILKKTPFYIGNAHSILFSTLNAWYEANMPSVTGTTDPWLQSRIDTHVFTKLEENDERVAVSYYEALKIVCEHWVMSVKLTDGIFRFIQLNCQADDGATYYERFYSTSAGAYVANSVPSYQVTIDRANQYDISGGVFTSLAPLHRIYIRYPFNNRNRLDQETTFPYSLNIPGTFIGGVSKRLKVAIPLEMLITQTPEVTSLWNLEIKLALILTPVGGGTTYYLKKDPLSSRISWSTLSTDFYIHVITDWHVYTPVTLYDIMFTTPEIPAGVYSAYIGIVALSITDALNSVDLTTDPYTVIFLNRQKGGSRLVYSQSNVGEEDAYYEYIGQNSSSTINSYNIELPDAVIGEMFDASDPGVLMTGSSSVVNVSTGAWSINKTGSTYDFNVLRAREILAGQTIPIRKYQGSFMGKAILAHSRLVFDGKIFILNGGTFDIEYEKVDGEWFAISYDRATYDEISGATNQTNGGGEGQLIKDVKDTGDAGQVSIKQLIALGRERMLTYTNAALPAGSQTEVPIAGVADGVIMQGDYLRIRPFQGQDNYLVKVAEDVFISDAVIKIEAYTFPMDIPAGAVIVFDSERPVLDISRLINLPTSDPGVAGKPYIDETGRLFVSL